MLSVNKVMITGRLTRDPETKYLPSGMAVTNLSVAVNRRYLDSKSNEWKEEVTFLDVETWGKLAERCAEQLKKGRPVYVEGRLKSDSWERDGQKHTRLKINAERVTAFDVPAGKGAGSEGSDMGDSGDAGNFGGGSGGSASGGARIVSTARPATPTGAPSDQLDFGAGPDSSVQDDIPF